MEWKIRWKVEDVKEKGREGGKGERRKRRKKGGERGFLDARYGDAIEQAVESFYLAFTLTSGLRIPPLLSPT